MDQIITITLIVLVVALLLAFATRLHTKHGRALKLLNYFVLGVYLLANLSKTLLFREVSPHANYELDLLWSYKQALSFDDGLLGFLRALFENNPHALAGAYITDRSLLKEIILNILLYVPMGYLLPFTWPRLARHRKANATQIALGKQVPFFKRILWRVVLIGLISSIFTELTQLVLHIGLFEFDDILNNTLGCLLGVLLFMWVMRNENQSR